ncbi:unnamed protein product [Cylindrotheca closterium]|uniref:Uncharacterized protein n=1 Tax=Cylindrotheca closterium TaxID=2856 RepID=A0AAD2FKY9_9STRA|nr:unnamed protein product [Cylindrotheca closterium]
MLTIFLWLLLLTIGDFKAALCFCRNYESATAKRHYFSVVESSQYSFDETHSGINNDKFHKQDGNSILGTVCVDYSAANEYIRAHYGDQSPRLPLYFEQEESIETVHDARCGVPCTTTAAATTTTNKENPLIGDDTTTNTVASLKTCGFTLVSPPAISPEDVQQNNWNNLEWIQRNRLPQWRKSLKQLYNHDAPNHQRTIRHMLFWNPMLRGPPRKPITTTTPYNNDYGGNTESFSSTPKASYAALPHIDMDVNAYDNFEDFLDLMENNEVEILDASDGGTLSANQERIRQRRQDILDSIQNKHRGFAIVNAWCNVGKHPVRKDPLGLFSVQYDDDKTTSSIAAFPMAAPNMNKSHWYAFSDMIPNEVLYFCQYDRDTSWPSDLWHCSLDGIVTTKHQGQQTNLPPRESFDIRCLLVFDEEVPLEQDRFQRANRLSSLLSLEESGCFCEGQFEERRREDGVSD